MLAAAGCTEKKIASDDPSVQVVEVALSDVGCEPSSMSAEAGATTFAVSNEGASGVTEFELMTEDRGRVLGEAENVGPRLESSFSLDLAAGSYTTYCPGGGAAGRAGRRLVGGDPVHLAAQQGHRAVGVDLPHLDDP